MRGGACSGGQDNGNRSAESRLARTRPRGIWRRAAQACGASAVLQGRGRTARCVPLRANRPWWRARRGWRVSGSAGTRGHGPVLREGARAGGCRCPACVRRSARELRPGRPSTKPCRRGCRPPGPLPAGRGTATDGRAAARDGRVTATNGQVTAINSRATETPQPWQSRPERQHAEPPLEGASGCSFHRRVGLGMGDARRRLQIYPGCRARRVHISGLVSPPGPLPTAEQLSEMEYELNCIDTDATAANLPPRRLPLSPSYHHPRTAHVGTAAALAHLRGERGSLRAGPGHGGAVYLRWP